MIVVAPVISTIPNPVRLSVPVPSPRFTAVIALMVKFLLPPVTPPFSDIVPAPVAAMLTLSPNVIAPLYVWLPVPPPALSVLTLVAPLLNAVVPETLKAPSSFVEPTVFLKTVLPVIVSDSLPFVVALTVLSNVTMLEVNVFVAFASSNPSVTALW